MRASMRDIDSLAVLTGAGISAESGIPTFRGHDGLWRRKRAEDLATPQAFLRDPGMVWEWYEWRRGLIARCLPNPAHHALVEMESHFADFTLITQNVDGLHQLAGSRNVVELHGNIWRLRCTRDCRSPWESREVPLSPSPPHCSACGALARPDVVWFGESLPEDALSRAWAASERCQVMLVIGTSALVQPAALLPLLALRGGARVVEINPSATPISSMVDEAIREPASTAAPRWWDAWRVMG